MVATVLGTEKPEEIVSFGAHYDSVDFSKGVYDNGAGSVINMEILRYFKENPPKRTLKFMWYGSEEIGLEGSWAYVKAHKEELANHLLMINVDVGGPVLGVDKITATAEQEAGRLPGLLCEDPRLWSGDQAGHLLQRLHPLRGLRGARGQLQPGRRPGRGVHPQPFDTLSFLSAEALEKTTRIVLAFSREMANAAVLPVERKIPQNIVEDVEKYLYKKELSEAAM